MFDRDGQADTVNDGQTQKDVKEGIVEARRSRRRKGRREGVSRKKVVSEDTGDLF